MRIVTPLKNANNTTSDGQPGAGVPSLAAGVMMIPISRAGVLRRTGGRNAAGAVSGIEEVTMTIPIGHEVVPLPEGNRYLGFILARGETAIMVEQSLRQAHLRLDIGIDPAAD